MLRIWLLTLALVGVSLVILPRVARGNSSEGAGDKLVVLPFSLSVTAQTARTAQTKGQTRAPAPIVDTARDATRRAATTVGRVLASPAEEAKAQAAIGEQTAGPAGNRVWTTEQYRAAGRSVTADWTVTGRVDPRPPSGNAYRVELEVCQVDTGRVESLAREINAPDAVTQIGEMLRLLLRPEGIGSAEAPWENAEPHAQQEPPLPQPQLPQQPLSQQPLQQQPLSPPPKYGEDRPFALGGAVRFTSAIERGARAQGNPSALWIGASFGYAIQSVPGLELRADASGSIAGPESISGDLGARYMFGIVPKWRIYAGPELGAGIFGTLEGDKTARFLGRGAAIVAIGIGHAQVEAGGEMMVAAGGDTSLLIAAAVIRSVYRFE